MITVMQEWEALESIDLATAAMTFNWRIQKLDILQAKDEVVPLFMLLFTLVGKLGTYKNSDYMVGGHSSSKLQYNPDYVHSEVNPSELLSIINNLRTAASK